MKSSEKQHSKRTDGIINANVGEEFKAKAQEIAAAQGFNITNWLRVMIQAEHAKLRRRKKED